MSNNALLFVNTQERTKNGLETPVLILKLQEHMNMHEYANSTQPYVVLPCQMHHQKTWTVFSESQRENSCRPTSGNCSVTVLVSLLNARKASWLYAENTSEWMSVYQN